jgi:hypothetical protein
LHRAEVRQVDCGHVTLAFRHSADVLAAIEDVAG